MNRIDSEHFEDGEFAFYLQTNGPIDSRRFVQFLDMICGQGIAAKRLPLRQVQILELANGSIRGRLKALFREKPWTQKQAETIEKHYEAAIRDSDPALRQADAADLANALTATGNQQLTLQTRIALIAMLGTFVGFLYQQTPTKEADLIAAMMQLDGVTRIEISTKSHSWTIERKDAEEYAERAEAQRALDTLRRRGDYQERRVRAEAIEPDDRGILEPELAKPDIERIRTIETALPVADRPPARAGRRINLSGQLRFAGDAHLFVPDEGHPRELILIPPEGQGLADGGRYQVSGRLFSPPGAFDILAAKLMQPLQ